MLEKITDFLIRVGDHCMSCEEKPVLAEPIIPIVTIVKPKPKSRNVKISYLQKWIQNNNFEVFTLDQFLKSFPKQRDNNRLNSNISSLIDKKIITQLGKDKFRVNR